MKVLITYPRAAHLRQYWDPLKREVVLEIEHADMRCTILGVEEPSDKKREFISEHNKKQS